MLEFTERYEGAPYLRVGATTKTMVYVVLGCLVVLAGLYAAIYDTLFILRFAAYLLLGLILEGLFFFLEEGRFRLQSGSSMITAGILVMSIPAAMPWTGVIMALIVAIILTKLSTAGRAIRLNPVLMGRLFLMLAFNQNITAWTRVGLPVDGVTTATPLELFHTEGATTSLTMLLTGHIQGKWGGMYEMVAGSPGEIFTPVILLMGVVMVWRGILDWRVGTAFLTTFVAMCAVIRQPVVFNLFSGAVVFSAVFIAGDPRTTPASKGGRWMAGVIAGVANALIRTYTFYSEGIVFSFLLANLLAPALDRWAFTWRGYWLIYRRRQFEKRHMP